MIGIKSDVGNVRKLNEDYSVYKEEDNYRIYVVADGMGGHNAGEIASKMASKKVIEFIYNKFGAIDEKDILKKAVEYANAEVYKFAHTDDIYIGMGTTLVACLITKNIINIANVGDSSCLGITGNDIIKLTKDHSLVQELLDFGSITEEEAKLHAQKNIITRAIGTKEFVEVDIFDVGKEKFNLFMLCTDGLSNEVSEKDILSILKEKVELNEACDKLVTLAKMRGGRDNITVMLFGGEV